MADDLASGAPAPGGEPTTRIVAPDGAKDAMGVREAARLLAQQRHKQELNSQAASAPPAAPPAAQSAPEADANPPAEGHGETAEAEAVEEPPIEPPLSWTTEAKQYWQSLPRETQQYVAQRESERESLLTKSQQELKERNLTLDGERQKMEQARQQYEGALPALMQALQQSIAGEFPDIQTMDDVTKLAREDWARYIAWDASQKKLANIASEAKAAQERQLSDLQSKWNTFAAEQDAAFIKNRPEFADKEKAGTMQRSAMKALTSVGFTEDEILRNWNGQQAFTLRDQRWQQIVDDYRRFHEAKAAVKNGPVKAAVPPVTRPGAAPVPGKALESKARELESALSKTTSSQRSARLAADLMAVRRDMTNR